MRILSLLAKKPMNLRQLSLAANLDYKTAEHHVDMLVKNSVLECAGGGYGQLYFVSDSVLAQKELAQLFNPKGGKNGRK